MNRYQERSDLMDVLLYGSREDQVEMINIEIQNVKDQIRSTKQEMSRLGISWFGEKRQRKLQLKAELKELKERLSALQRLRNLGNMTL